MFSGVVVSVVSVVSVSVLVSCQSCQNPYLIGQTPNITGFTGFTGFIPVYWPGTLTLSGLTIDHTVLDTLGHTLFGYFLRVPIIVGLCRDSVCPKSGKTSNKQSKPLKPLPNPV